MHSPLPSSPSKSLRTLSIGGATFDLFVRTGKDDIATDKDHTALLLPIGHKIRVQEVVEACGGGASNTSVGLARLGMKAAFCGIIGSDQWGQRMLENLRTENVDSTSATVIEHETSSFSIILNAGTGDRVILYATGVNAHLHDVTFDKESAKSMDWIYFNHIHESSFEIEDDIASILGDGRTGMTWNPGGRQLKKGVDDAGNRSLLSKTDILLLNKEEVLAFTGKKDADHAIKALLKCGTHVVCVTDGKHGCIASDGKSMYSCPAIGDALVVDATGAGDAFGTGFTWAMLTLHDLPIALRAGTINATSVIATTGAETGLLTHTEMQKRLTDSPLTVDVRPIR